MFIAHLLNLVLTLSEVSVDPNRWENQEIAVRGFLYRNEDGQVVLSSEPNLRSCCVAKKSFIVLEGNLPQELPSRAIMVSGRIAENKIVQAKIVPEGNSFGWVFGSVFGGLIAFQLYRWKRRRDKLLP